jgi:hypothetical protein
VSDVPAPMRSNTHIGQFQASRFSKNEDFGQTIEAYPERANLYPLTLLPMPRQLYSTRCGPPGHTHEEIVFGFTKDATAVDPTSYYIRQALQQAILRSIQGKPGYRVKTHSLQPLIIDVSRDFSPKQQQLQIVQAYRPRIIEFSGSYWLCLDHHLIERSLLRLDKLEHFDAQFHPLPGQRMLFKQQQSWMTGKLLRIEGDTYLLELPTGEEVHATKNELVPSLSRMQLARLAPTLGFHANEHERIIKQLSFLTIAQAPRARLRVSFSDG